MANDGRTHIEVLEFCTWPRPGKPVSGLIHLGIRSLGANDMIEWVEVETGICIRDSVPMTSHILVRRIPSVSSIQIKECCI